ncbi:capsule biosynthesis protein [Testudinibacter aquarius]|uniref:Capsular polysaccharide export protein n=1 Tax=Testudinibacter aquarius TaxID=1524974 RepID=A0A4R3Y674_9PAST|nr:capsule biosynthesis protein [Testudinibacter aquarius]KAE9526002.1 capsule biosynthesis protein [Testudinibacter aquarius]TCV87307.1 capsular polysaccharide export protein [Testudinibacter aquarius]TNG89804.1 capsule biosynthesis protein [Testudinibacter aquarius]
MLSHNLDDLITSAERILLLQGPIGHFFQNFAQWLQSQGKTVYKINFNAGDEYFYPNTLENTFAYRDSLEQFSGYLTRFCREHQIDALVCFGDNRHYHKIAKKIATASKLSFWVFEEGYFRPDYITLEKDGVNAFSTIPHEADFFIHRCPQAVEPPKPQKVAQGFVPMAKLAIGYYRKAYLNRAQYPHYRHHRILNVLYYIKLWLISGIKRFSYMIRDHSFAKKVEQGHFGNFYILPLQVYDDSQINVHSDYSSVAQFLREVLDSFAQTAPDNLSLIVKHHPMDRGFIDYQQVINEYKARYSHLNTRLYYIHDVPMPVFLRYGKGMVTLNSTSGISALLHAMPVITLGRAHYNIPGLTYQGKLDNFWHTPEKPNMKLFSAYRRFHLNKTQLNGSFYNRVILRYPYYPQNES